MEAPREYLKKKYSLDLEQKPPIFIDETGRWRGLVHLFRIADYTVGAEIGVERGVYAERLCQQLPKLKLYAIDPWAAYKGYREHVSQPKLDNFYEITKKKLASYNCEIIRKFSMAAVEDFEDESLDFVYIDGNHDFKNVANDIVEWEKKVRAGGIVSGHDFRRQKRRVKYTCHVKDVVQAYTYAYGIRPWFVFRGGGGLGDASPSWFWIKEEK